MLILSWNVAAWEPAVSHIDDVCDFLNRHHADIVCLQEVKVSSQKLENEPDKVVANLRGWDTFWATNQHKDSKGFQGVATFAKAGMTIKASRHPFRDPHLNSLGRCIRTEHAKFVLFNVYAPAACNPLGPEFRLKFYKALWEAMALAKEETSKPVILCGDLNVQLNSKDLYYNHRAIRVDKLLQGQRKCLCGHLAEPDKTCEKDCCNFKQTLRLTWPKILSSLEKRQVVEQVTYSANKVARKRYHVKIPVEINGSNQTELFRIGELYDSHDRAHGSYDFEAIYPGESKHVLCYPGHTLSVAKLVNLLDVVGKCKLEIFEVVKLANNCGESRNALPLLELLSRLQKELGLVDALLLIHPQLDYRYTCWSQYTNGRYKNLGSRIDYFLVEKSLEHAIDRTKVDLSCGCAGHQNNEQYSWKAGICAATAGGRFRQASFNGGGIEDTTRAAFNTQFPKVPHTGIVYTPPKLSDHVGITLLLNDVALGGRDTLFSCTLDRNDKETKLCQPHKKQKSIKSFFTKRRDDNNQETKLRQKTETKPQKYLYTSKRKPASIWERTGFQKKQKSKSTES